MCESENNQDGKGRQRDGVVDFLISDVKLTGRSTRLLSGRNSMITWTYGIARGFGKTSNTFSSELNFIANSFSWSRRDLMRSARVVSGPTASGSMSWQDRMSRTGNTAYGYKRTFIAMESGTCHSESLCVHVADPHLPKSHARRTNADTEFLLDGLFEVVNVGALSNSDLSGSLLETRHQIVWCCSADITGSGSE